MFINVNAIANRLGDYLVENDDARAVTMWNCYERDQERGYVKRAEGALTALSNLLDKRAPIPLPLLVPELEYPSYVSNTEEDESYWKAIEDEWMGRNSPLNIGSAKTVNLHR